MNDQVNAEPAAGGARAWLKVLLTPHSPGMVEHTPVARWVPALIIVALLSLQVVARYELDFLHHKRWQLLHIAIGWTSCLAVIAIFHGPGVLRRVRPRTWFVLALAAGMLAVFWHYGRMDSYWRYWRDVIPPEGHYGKIYSFMYFSTSATVLRLVVPFGIMWAFFKMAPGVLGLRARTNPHAPTVRRVWIIYLILFLGVAPFVYGASLTDVFQAKYPLGRAIIGPEGGIAFEHFIVYQAFYLMIFVSGESFWRGLLTFGTERDFGLYGLLLMVVPYVTAHFGKPLSETLGAILAGTVLGFLALKHRSVWLGVALHYGVALSMDLLSILHNGFVIYTYE